MGTRLADDRGSGAVRDEPLFELPEELAIDTDVARRAIAAFIRGQLRQAGFENAVLGLSGGIDSALVAYLVTEAIGAERLLCVMMPYRASSPASQGRCRGGRRGPRLHGGAGRDHRHGGRLLRA